MKFVLMFFLFSFGLCSAQDSTAEFHADFAVVADEFEREWLVRARALAEMQYRPLEANADRTAQLFRKEHIRLAVMKEKAYIGELRKIVGDALWRLRIHIDYTPEKKIRIFEFFEEHYRRMFIYLDYQFFEALQKNLIPESESSMKK